MQNPENPQLSTRRQAVLISLVTISSLVCIITLAIAFVHWHDALDACTDADCGCLLYSRTSSSTYTVTGSDGALCWFTGLLPLPGFILALCLAVFYVYRGYIKSPKPSRPLVIRNGSSLSTPALSMRLMGTTGGAPRAYVGATDPGLFHSSSRRRANRLARTATFLTVQCMISGLFGLVAVAHVAVLTDGYLATCHEYRKTVLKTLSASGNLAALVNERFSCPVVYDFLDYMKPDKRIEQRGPYHWYPGERPLTIINSSATLVIALMFSWAHMFLWFLSSGYAGMLAKNTAGRAKEARRTAMHITDL